MELETFEGKTVLVTGGTGSIGGQVVRQVLSLNPAAVRVYSRSEEKQFFMQRDLSDHANLRFLIGDVRDDKRVQMAMRGVDIVIHAAAMKHVPASEYNPFEAIKTNILGTQNVIEAALENDVERVVLISTDKAVNPVNTMGATKLLAEKLVLGANRYRGPRQTIFAVVRFGNVLGSSGSVVPLFADQIKSDENVTLTDPQMTRFIMSIPEAVRLTLRACAMARHGDTFVLKMPAVRVQDIAVSLVEDYRAHGHQYSGSIVVTGAREGERLHEQLMTNEEVTRVLEDDVMYVIPPENYDPVKYQNDYSLAHLESYSSETAGFLSVSDFQKIASDNKLEAW